MSDDLAAALAAMSYLTAPRPGPGRAMARLEIVTSSGRAAVSLPAISLRWDDGRYLATAEADGLTWSASGPNQGAAVLALLASRIGLRADIGREEE